ncbi:hypothetical protein OH460_07845 [Vibrio sp. Makdt]|uniref:hypothetical protein n=1 Tax=Vibrio sp. Makdt TaxID=2998828 RepID=UPI0022CDB68D|nr:hypothetical protein [Vibrio sp. Makdt]MDA0152209.1 hypothetical protein [Vibrio sp. Makdt]
MRKILLLLTAITMLIASFITIIFSSYEYPQGDFIQLIEVVIRNIGSGAVLLIISGLCFKAIDFS